MFKVKTNPNRYAGVKGRTVIIHQIRCQLGLTMEEYVVMEFFAEYRKVHPSLSIKGSEVLKATGMKDSNEILEIVGRLKEMDLLAPNHHNKLSPTDKWLVFFAEDDQFEKLWEALGKRGSKARAKRYYSKAIKEVAFDELLRKAEQYIASKEEGDPIMHVSTFLSPSDRNWENDFSPAKLEKKGTYGGKFGTST